MHPFQHVPHKVSELILLILVFVESPFHRFNFLLSRDLSLESELYFGPIDEYHKKVWRTML